eukprot:c3993_g2_i1 orf=549-914(-)
MHFLLACSDLECMDVATSMQLCHHSTIVLLLHSIISGTRPMPPIHHAPGFTSFESLSTINTENAQSLHLHRHSLDDLLLCPAISDPLPLYTNRQANQSTTSELLSSTPPETATSLHLYLSI